MANSKMAHGTLLASVYRTGGGEKKIQKKIALSFLSLLQMYRQLKISWVVVL